MTSSPFAFPIKSKDWRGLPRGFALTGRAPVTTVKVHPGSPSHPVPQDRPNPSDPESLGRTMKNRNRTKFIFVTGGVVSSLGKGIVAASCGALLETRGLKVAMMKCDPYINVDPGT